MLRGFAIEFIVCFVLGIIMGGNHWFNISVVSTMLAWFATWMMSKGLK